MSNDLQKSTVSNPLVLLQSMIERGTDPAQLEKMMGLAERWEQNQAAKEFADALTGFQTDCPIIKKEQSYAVGGGRITFASYDDIMRAIKPHLSRWRIVTTFSSKNVEGGLEVTCRVRVGTHFEESTMTVAIPNEMRVNGSQKSGAARSFAKRYVLCDALNITVSDEDNDASALIETLTDQEQMTINELIDDRDVKLDKFWPWVSQAAGLPIKCTADMPRGQFEKVAAELRRKPFKGKA